VSCEAEFATVDLIIRSNAETRGVDAFALALLKAERQIRRLFIHLVYQFPCFGENVLVGCVTRFGPIDACISRDSSAVSTPYILVGLKNS
jgi:hypothetical protein